MDKSGTARSGEADKVNMLNKRLIFKEIQDNILCCISSVILRTVGRS